MMENYNDLHKALTISNTKISDKQIEQLKFVLMNVISKNMFKVINLTRVYNERAKSRDLLQRLRGNYNSKPHSREIDYGF